MDILKNFMPDSQLKRLQYTIKSNDENTELALKVTILKERIVNMPRPYETDGQGDNAVVVLHYFANGSDWYVIERDSTEEQIQAFGYACLNGDYQNAELGYINIQELIRYGIELDLFWTPQKLSAVRLALLPIPALKPGDIVNHWLSATAGFPSWF